MLTGLYGNHAFCLKIIQIIEEKEPFGIMVFGIDNFKNINDLYSYSFGDMVLKQFANEIKNMLLPETQLFRLDGDRFALLHKGIKESELEAEYKKVQIIAQTPKKMQGLTISFAISAGIVAIQTMELIAMIYTRMQELRYQKLRLAQKKAVFTTSLNYQKKLE